MARPTILAVISTLALAALTGAAFAGWLNHGGAMLLAYVEAGLAWCF